MPRLAVVGVVAGLAVITLGSALWLAERQADGEPAGAAGASRNRQSIAATVATPRDTPIQEATIGAAASEGSTNERSSADERDVARLLDDDAELQAAFEELLNDPDPEVRREAGQLARDFGVLGGTTR